MNAKDIQDKLDNLTVTIEAERQQVVNAVSELKSEIQGLKDAIANGATQEELDRIAAGVDAAANKVQNIYPNIEPTPTPGE